MAICRRNLLHMRGSPMQLVSTAIFPMLFGVVLIYVFGGAISNGRMDYKEYVLPGITFQTVAVASRLTGTWLNLDFTTGMMDRFRSFPIARSSVLIGRITADLCRMIIVLLLMSAFGFAIGFRVSGGPLAVLASMLLMVGLGVALSWVSAFIGLVLRRPQSVQMTASLWMIPLQFGSSMFVPPDTMPGWLRVFAEVNPVTLVCDASRDLLTGADAARPVLGTILWILGTITVFGPLTVMRYARRV
ncbi:ABC transporter permease [Amycolatopsis pigmentata]|uniref:Transport permease protein n=1 Tax=Amycolatopsis pigmentata TaxID=450801 RepID=A0ABW5FL34_9PSEU